MQLTETALALITDPQIRMKIGVALGVTDQAILKAIKNKSDTLTKYASLEVIKKETGLSEVELLEV